MKTEATQLPQVTAPKLTDESLNELKDKLIHLKVRVKGILEQLHTFRDGSVLVVDNFNGKVNGFFKLSHNDIKPGKFIRGRFRYDANKIITRSRLDNPQSVSAMKRELSGILMR